ncbi:hypothetical protein CAC42_1229 [Sphaceloma murrayae]|uniref:Uncharacterized protein n=1 Tax=Sphaceloma murrayae TaxID=2082308 RepID=A0A2K1R2E9_9PEZI|nr:hypothetical protein CAC42_1229 [Sphaceloma murrayae]
MDDQTDTSNKHPHRTTLYTPGSDHAILLERTDGANGQTSTTESTLSVSQTIVTPGHPPTAPVLAAPSILDLHVEKMSNALVIQVENAQPYEALPKRGVLRDAYADLYPTHWLSRLHPLTDADVIREGLSR